MLVEVEDDTALLRQCRSGKERAHIGITADDDEAAHRTIVGVRTFAELLAQLRKSCVVHEFH